MQLQLRYVLALFLLSSSLVLACGGPETAGDASLDGVIVDLNESEAPGAQSESDSSCPTCEACTTNDDCGQGGLCATLSDGRAVCTSPCDDDTDCNGEATCVAARSSDGAKRYGLCLSDDTANEVCPENWSCTDEEPLEEEPVEEEPVEEEPVEEEPIEEEPIVEEPVEEEPIVEEPVEEKPIEPPPVQPPPVSSNDPANNLCDNPQGVCRYCGPPTGAVTSCPSSDNSVNCQVLRLVNQERARVGLGQLTYNAELAKSAQKHAMDMSTCDYFSHYSLDGTSFFERCAEGGYTGRCSGENIAGGQRTAQLVFNAWMNSPSHKRNIHAAQHTELGVGYYTNGGHYTRYWVQHFGRR
ncbi:MAG: CAP domain-containing protein [Bradymonadaceae bacterium]|nr:CAP domain-containing protein [Lujinxingiaceae bacterium]